MRYGLVGFPLGGLYSSVDVPPAAAVREIARAAEDMGFDFVCGQDHIVVPRAWAASGSGTAWFDPFVVLTAAAGVTQRLELLTDVVVLPYRSPFTVAKAAATLDVMSEGRLILGVASGYLEEEFRVLGAEFERRGDWTDEGIEVVKAAWTNDWLHIDGTFFSAGDMAVAPRPVQQPRPRIWVGGNSSRALRRAVEHADGWTPFSGDPERLAGLLERYRDRIDARFEIAVPLRRVHDGTATFDAGAVREWIDALARIGVTHLKVSFKGPTLREYLRAMSAFASSVIEG